MPVVIDGIEYEDGSPEAIAYWERAEREASEEREREERTRPLVLSEVFERYILPYIVPDANVLLVPEPDAHRMARFYPEWAQGRNYLAGYRVRAGDALYKCTRVHVAVKGSEPGSEQGSKYWEAI